MLDISNDSPIIDFFKSVVQDAFGQNIIFIYAFWNDSLIGRQRYIFVILLAQYFWILQ